MIYILVLSMFGGDPETGSISLSTFTVLVTIIYLFMIVANIFAIKAVWKMCKNKVVNVFDKVSLGLSLLPAIIFVCFEVSKYS